MTDKRIVFVERALFPDLGTLLIGKNIKGEFVVGIPVKPRDASKWMRNGGTTVDRKRLQKAADRVQEYDA